MRVVEVGQYFVTKDTGILTQYRSVACREYTLPRDDPASQAKGWIQGNMRTGPVLEVTTSFQHFKYGIEIRIWSVNRDNSQSWVRISYGTAKYVGTRGMESPRQATNRRRRTREGPEPACVRAPFLFSGWHTCVGCDIVQADHAPEAGVAQGIFHGVLVRHHGRIQEEVEEGLENKGETRGRRQHSRTSAHADDHGWK